MTGNGFPARLRASHQSRRPVEVRRRNGKLQSCEPCRKGKLRCDHMLPACGRCTRRNKPEQCVYHPAPLTKANAPPTPQATDSETSRGTPPKLLSSEVDSRLTQQCIIESPRSSFPVTRVGDSVPLSFPSPQAKRRSSQEPRPSRPWSPRHGPTESYHNALRNSPDQTVAARSLESRSFVSHDALLAENECNVGIYQPSPVSQGASSIPQPLIDAGTRILSLLEDLPIFETYIEKWFSYTRGAVVIKPMVNIWTSQLWAFWNKVLRSHSTEGLRDMSECLWSNTTKPLNALLGRDTTPRQFCLDTSGVGLRWEVVGLIFSLVGLLAQTLQDGDPIFCSHDSAPVDRAALARAMYNASEACLKFCQELDEINDLMSWLMYENTILGCSMHPKGSYRNFQKTGQLYNALLACGLHQEIKVDDRIPFFIVELRKRLFICAYENDKYTAAFMGRPPRLTRQYCRIQLPLDLDDAQIMSDGADLENALKTLDDDGWNRCGTIQRCTYARIFASNALITEEILEISLGLLSKEEICQRASAIESRALAHWDSLPGFLKLDSEHPWDSKRAPIELLFLSYIRLAYTGHHFLLQRTLIKKVGADSSKLLVVAKDTFDFVLQVVNHRDLFRDFQIDLTHMICAHGIPSAAVVAVELLHQEQNPSLPSPSLTTPSSRNLLPRSDTIQDLSVFASFLGNIGPENNAYGISNRGRKFLKKILDTILSPGAPSTVAGTPGSNGEGSGEGMEDPCLTVPLFQMGSDGDFVRWLESMEEEGESWVNFG